MKNEDLNAHELALVECANPNCGIKFAVSSTYLLTKAKAGESIYCPEGHILGPVRQDGPPTERRQGYPA